MKEYLQNISTWLISSKELMSAFDTAATLLLTLIGTVIAWQVCKQHKAKTLISQRQVDLTEAQVKLAALERQRQQRETSKFWISHAANVYGSIHDLWRYAAYMDKHIKTKGRPSTSKTASEFICKYDAFINESYADLALLIPVDSSEFNAMEYLSEMVKDASSSDFWSVYDGFCDKYGKLDDVLMSIKIIIRTRMRKETEIINQSQVF